MYQVEKRKPNYILPSASQSASSGIYTASSVSSFQDTKHTRPTASVTCSTVASDPILVSFSFKLI